MFSIIALTILLFIFFLGYRKLGPSFWHLGGNLSLQGGAAAVGGCKEPSEPAGGAVWPNTNRKYRKKEKRPHLSAWSASLDRSQCNDLLDLWRSGSLFFWSSDPLGRHFPSSARCGESDAAVFADNLLRSAHVLTRSSRPKLRSSFVRENFCRRCDRKSVKGVSVSLWPCKLLLH